VRLRAKILNSLVFNLRTTVRAIRGSLRDAVHVFSASLRIIWLYLGKQYILLKGVLGRYGLRRPVRDDFALVDSSG
jgi:hypothetical protein